MKVDIRWGAYPELPPGPQLVGLDVEGAKRNPRCFQFAYEETAYLFDMAEDWHRDRVYSILANPNLEFVSHSRYDVDATHYAFGIDLTGRTRDSFLMACLAYPGELWPHGLKPLSTKLIDKELQDAEAALYEVFKATYGGKKEDDAKTGEAGYVTRGYHELDIHHPAYEKYSAMDPCYALKLYHLLKSQGVARVSGPVFFRGQREVDILGASSLRGLRVDTHRVAELRPVEEEKVERGDKAMQELVGLKARSPDVPWLLESMGVEFLERNDAPDEPTKRDPACKGSPKLDKHALKTLIPKYAGTHIGEILAARGLVSKSSNRVSNLNNFLKYSKESGYVHPNYKSAAAATGRMSITSPALQTLAKGDDDTGLRTCFVARPGFTFVGADFDSQELRVAAALSGDVELARRIFEGADMHQVVADQIGVSRQVAKVFNFACLFGAGPFAIARQTGLGYATTYDKKTGKEWPDWNCEAAQARQGWWDMWPGLQAWDQENRRKTKEREWANDCIELDSGRYLPVDYPHKTTNYFVQGTGRDITQRAILHYEELMPDTLALVIHDELLVEVRIGQERDAMLALNSAMNFGFKSAVCPWGIEMPFTATAKVVGDRWGVKHED